MSPAAAGNVIMVVDPCESDYQALVRAGEAVGIRFDFLKTGEEALRAFPRFPVLAWIINAELPCLTGAELYLALESRLNPGTRVFIVDNAYDEKREISVLGLGRPYYSCKPITAALIDWLPVESSD